MHAAYMQSEKEQSTGNETLKLQLCHISNDKILHLQSIWARDQLIKQPISVAYIIQTH